MILLVADYETTTNPNGVEVWLSGFTNCVFKDDINKISIQTNIRDFSLS